MMQGGEGMRELTSQPIEELAEDVYVCTRYYGANVGCVVTYEGAVFVDAPIVPAQARAWLADLQYLTAAEFLYTFVTDAHPTHSLGCMHLRAKPIANERAYRSLARYTPTMREKVYELFQDWAPEVIEELRDFEPLPPEITFEEELVLYKGGRELHMIRIGGHTPATSVFFVSDCRVLFTGDLVVEGTAPFLGMGDLGEWLDGLGQLLELQPKLVVPGHGKPGGPEIIERMKGRLERLFEGVATLVAEGRSRAETITRMLPVLEEFEIEEQWRKRAERSFRTSIGRIYEDLKARKLGPEQRAE
jgi:cyclase